MLGHGEVPRHQQILGQPKVVHRLQITPVKRNKFNPLLSKYCNKCKIIEGSYFHCIFECPLINDLDQSV